MQFALDHHIDLVRFKKGQRKDDVMQARLRAFKKKHRQEVVFIGVAQQPANVEGQRGSALRFGDPRAQALFAVLGNSERV